MPAPLLTRDKARFLARRWPQTLLGGLNLLPGCHSCAPVLLEVAMFVLPLACALPASLVASYLLAARGSSVAVPVACGLSGVLCCLIVLGVRVAALQLSTDSVKRVGGAQSLVEIFDDCKAAATDEGGVEFPSDSCRSRFMSTVTCGFLFPENGRGSAVLFALCSGVLAAGAAHYFLPTRFSSYTGLGQSGSVVLLAVSWFAFLTGIFSITTRPPPEPTRFSPVAQSPLLCAFSRPLYLASAFALDLTARWVPSLQLANTIVHWAVVFLPLGWLAGLAPEFHVLLEWFSEQVDIHVLGGTPTTTTGRIIRACPVSVLSFCVTYFLMHWVSAEIAIGWAAGCGFFLSGNSILAGKVTRRLVLKVVSEILISLWIAGASVGLSFVGSKVMTALSPAIYPAAAVLCAVAVGGILIGQLQRPFLFGILRNPLFGSKGIQRVLQTLLYWGTAVSTVLFVTFNSLFISNCIATSGGRHAVMWWRSALITRAMRWPWQSTPLCSLESAIVSLLLIPKTNNVTDVFAVDTALFVVGCGLSRLRGLLSRLHFVVLHTLSSLGVSKLRFTNLPLAMLLELVFFPVSLLSALVSSALDSPVVPLFGLPLFIVGFPRPKRSWPSIGEGDGTACSDAVYYEQLVPRILVALQGNLRAPGLVPQIAQALGASTSGFIGTVSVGDCWVLRVETRLLFISIVEKGRGYSIASLRGLELRPTSCHNVEGMALDDLFASAFGTERATSDGVAQTLGPLNPFLLSAVTPMTQMELSTYSVSKMTLTGVVDSPSVGKMVDALFWKTLIWGFRERLNSDPDFVMRNGDFPRVNEKIIPGSLGISSKLPKSWFDYLLGSKFIEVPATGRRRIKKDRSRAALSPVNPPVHPPSKLALPLIKSAEDMSEGTPEDADPFQLPDQLRDKAKESARRVPEVSSPKPLTETEEDSPEDLAKKFLVCCYSMIQLFGLGGIDPTNPGASHILRVFAGNVPPSAELEWLNRHPHVLEMVLKAWRYAVKLAIDAAVNGEEDMELRSEELYSSLEEIDRLWHLDSTTSSDWLRTVAGEEKPHLFGVSREHTGGGTANDVVSSPGESQERKQAGQEPQASAFGAVALNLKTLPVSVGAVNVEVMRGFWAGLAMELLYATNDDDERYSVQAHKQLLRNLSIQQAEQPLGYPAFQLVTIMPRPVKSSAVGPAP